MRTQLLPLLTLLTLLSTALPVQAGSLTLLVVDSSRTMQERWEGTTKWEQVTAYCATLVRNLRGADEVGLITFGNDRCEPALQVTPSDPALAIPLVESHLTALLPTGDRALVGGIESAMLLASDSRADLVRILVFTSGLDQCRDDLRSLIARARNVRVPLELQIFGLDMRAEAAFELTEVAGAIGGTFRPFEGSQQFTASLPDTRQSSRPGLQVLVNVPRDAMDDEQLAPRLEVYLAGTSTVIWQQTLEGSAFVELTPGIYDVQVRWAGDGRWQRNVRIGGPTASVVQFDFSQGIGKIQLQLQDDLGGALPGAVRIINVETGAEVSNQQGRSTVSLDLPPGTYRAEIRIGTTFTEEEFVVGEGDNRIMPIFIESVLGQALISINNQDLSPVNADIRLYDRETGSLMETWQSTSWIRANLPEGEYEAVIRAGTQEESQIFQVYEGEETEVEFSIQLPLGSIYVRLEDRDGLPVWGILRVFDSQGQEVKYQELELIEDSDFSVQLPVGTYSLRATADGVTKTMSSVTVREDEETEVQFVFGSFGRDDDDGFR